jgi:hypothetical protein
LAGFENARAELLSPCGEPVRGGDDNTLPKEEDMRYALLIYDVPGAMERLGDEEREAAYGEYYATSKEPGVTGGAQLQPVESATTVRVEDGRTLTTDGPFADTKEFLGGFYLLEADDLDAALALAARIPAARLGGKVEVRPLVEPRL